jgi:protein-L-isoaspartate(D-aspartate) O-methyltransferase
MPATSATDLKVIRRAYARQIMAAAGIVHERVADAFAAVPREDFLGPGPWPIVRFGKGYVLSPDDDPVYLYADVLVGIDPERELNNGQPSLHALLLAQLDMAPGQHVVHIGAGTGYYSAILAELVGRAGRVTAIEYDAALAQRAAANLRPWPWVSLVEGDGVSAAFAPAERIYVNAGATHPVANWLDRLADGGRIILPLSAVQLRDLRDAAKVRQAGAVFLIERQGDRYGARWVSPVAIFGCAGARDDAAAAALAEGLKRGGVERVRHLQRRPPLPSDDVWLRGADWCLTCEEE